jgi:hypothetical protein
MATATTTETTTSSDEEVTNPTTPATPPQFEQPLEDLLPSSIFSKIDEVRAWVVLYISTILKFAPAIEAVTNQVNASSSELQARGTRTVERLIKAQAVFLQAKDSFWGARGKKGIDELQALLAEMRRDDASDEEFEAACNAFFAEYSTIQAELGEKSEHIAKIQELLAEELFRDRVLESNGGLQAWQRKLIQEVLSGKGAKQNLKSLSVTCSALQRQFDQFFGLGRHSATTGKPKAKKGGRSAEKREADRQATLARRGKKG